MTGNQGLIALALYHGRRTPDEDLDGWGLEGPQIGPLEAIFITYGSDIRLHFPTQSAARAYFPDVNGEECWLQFRHDGMIEFRGIFYGDFSVSAYQFPSGHQRSLL